MGKPRKITAVTASALAAVSMGTVSLTAAPAAADASRTAATAAYQYRAYHGLDFLGSYNRTKSYQGNKALRPVALSVGLQQSQKRYAAFWDNRPGPAWLERVVPASGYQKLFDTLTEPETELNEGGNIMRPSYQPTVVSATGSGSGAEFAAIFEKRPGRFFARHDINTAGLRAANSQARRDGYIPVSVNVYGTPSAPRYVAVWADNPSRVAWNVTISVPAAEYQKVFDAQVKLGFRPSAIAVGPDGRSYTTVWRKDKIGAGYAVHGLTAAQYQARFDEMTAKGLYPTWIDMENGVYAAIFTTR
ncbi:hypothetical protein ACQP1K_24640 [Sphaerimonospora sp. CA-214678]|uniref:hypothetical protein n=1 Tax=Sphaerimonospora sp. CA-214678 TaxID=3240029 RepID=UPI003D89F529